MSTHLTLEDGRVLGTSNGAFDAILELIAAELADGRETLPGLVDWLLDQRCEVQGPGVGYLDLRELSSPAVSQIREAFLVAHAAHDMDSVSQSLRAIYGTLRAMWASIERGEAPEALTSDVYMMGPPSGRRKGPGW
jgi:hypothetical protein